MRVVVGIAGGLGNSVFLLPMIAGLKQLPDMHLTAYIDADYPDMRQLWERCRYFDAVVDGRGCAPPDADVHVSGHWCPRRLKQDPLLEWYRWTTEPDYPHSEWELAWQAVEDLAYVCNAEVPAVPDVRTWCRDLAPSMRCDVGIICGSKPGIVWARKRWEGMPQLSQALLARGHTVGLFGLPEDNQRLPCTVDYRGAYTLRQLPDALAGCRVIVGTDSGPTHLAASLGIPTCFIFTATSRVKGEPIGNTWRLFQRPLPCSPCQSTPRWTGCTDWLCQQIAVDPIVAAVNEWLQS